MHKFKFWDSVLLMVCILEFGIFNYCHAFNLDKLKIYFLKGDYAQAITEGEKLLWRAEKSAPNLDELYYILGLSYLKNDEGFEKVSKGKHSYLRASDIFEIILKEFKESVYTQPAKLALGDAYFLAESYEKAQGRYRELLNSNPKVNTLPSIYYRLSRCAAELGNLKEASEYLSKLKKEFPLSFEAQLNEPTNDEVLYYTVQVGYFSSRTNARNFCSQLSAKGFDAYLEEHTTGAKHSYGVRVGRLASRREAVQLKDKLQSEGYPAHIIP